LSTKTSTRPSTLQEQQRMFNEIFGEHNDELYSTHDIQSQIWEKVSQISECIRKENISEIRLSAIHAVKISAYVRMIEIFKNQKQGGRHGSL
jgi:hypothetical protein